MASEPDIHVAKLEVGVEGLKVMVWTGNKEERNYLSAQFSEDPEKAYPFTDIEEAKICREALEDAFPEVCFLVGQRQPTEAEKH